MPGIVFGAPASFPAKGEQKYTLFIACPYPLFPSSL
jgi:hypothetical protein